MKLLNFSGRGIHGFLDIDIEFKSDLTFLTGINGSGKTSIINSIIALISPSIRGLAELEYASIRIELENGGRREYVEAQKTDTAVSLLCSNSDVPFLYAQFVNSPDVPLSEETRYTNNYYAEIASNGASNPVIKYITALPTPMFLGLDRRSAILDDDVRVTPPWARAPARVGRNIFGTSLTASLRAAASLANARFRDALIRSGRLTESLQKELMLELLTVTPSRDFGFSISKPSEADIRDIKTLRKDVDVLPSVLRLPAKDVRQRIIPFLDELDQNISQIPEKTPLTEIMVEAPNSPSAQAVMKWSQNISQLRKIKVVSNKLRDYNSRREEIMEPTERYLKLVNKFLKDSGKKLAADESGYIYVDINGISDPKPINSLSSGEVQIFVILTHLAFNPSAQEANVFIIDEPELSLHVQWQEIFVDSMRSANPGIQYILATHSPSIILDKVPACVDISRRKTASRGRRG